MRKIFLFLVFIFLISIIQGMCDEGEININTASLEELDKLSGIGPVKAQAIIDARPFQSLDNLIDVVGIGEVTLANIKQQGLACVSDEEENYEEDSSEEDNSDEELEEEEKEEDEEEDEIKNNKENKIISTNIQESQEIIQEEIKTINLTPQTPKSIKSEKSKEELDKNKLAIYGLIFLCILLAFLFLLERRKNEKSEFR